MSAAPIDEQRVLEALRQVPAIRWGEVVQFLESLRPSSGLPSGNERAIRTLGELLQSELVGLWANRTDIADNHQFARELRRQASQRRKEADAP